MESAWLRSRDISLGVSYADAYLKTTRAKVHLDALREELDAFYKSKPYSLIGEEDVENGVYIIRQKIMDIPDRAVLILGDLLNCTRASLDQLTYALARLTLDYPAHTQFPIIGELTANSRKRFNSYTLGVPAEAVRIIESLQPYHGADRAAVESHLLRRLNLLCIIDKHRRIPIHSSVTEFGPVLPTSAEPYVTVEDGNKVRMPIRFKSQVNLNPDATIEIIFGDAKAGIQCTFEGIEGIYNFVADGVLPRFARFFQ
jgi:hypothetical protein